MVTSLSTANSRAERVPNPKPGEQVLTRGLPGVSLSSLPQSQGSGTGEPGLGVCFCGMGGQRLRHLYPSPSAIAISGYGGGIIWCETWMFTPLLFCYVTLPPPPLSPAPSS